jgi:hypothetical protein
LHRTARNDEDELGFYAVFMKNALLLCDPERRNVVADGAVSDQELRGFGGKGR